MHKQKLGVWGNSVGLRFPQAIINQLGWKKTDIVSFEIKGDKVLISKADKVKIPDFVAEQIEFAKNRDNTLFDVYDNLRLPTAPKQRDWLNEGDNAEKLLKAWNEGYEVE